MKKPTEMTLTEIEFEIENNDTRLNEIVKGYENSKSPVERHKLYCEIKQIETRCKKLKDQRLSLLNHELIVLKRYLGKDK